ncbi:MAG: hypothetical protein SGI72_14650 [Planctomycetota bacterium]|nr:hypothetical protein [Planctomycetota bacterium]
MNETVPPPSNDACTTPISILGFGTFAIDNRGATTGAQGQVEALCNFWLSGRFSGSMAALGDAKQPENKPL